MWSKFNLPWPQKSSMKSVLVSEVISLVILSNSGGQVVLWRGAVNDRSGGQIDLCSAFTRKNAENTELKKKIYILENTKKQTAS